MMRLLMWDGRINPKTTKDMSRIILAEISSILEYAIEVALSTMIERGALLRTVRDQQVVDDTAEDPVWFWMQFPEYKVDPTPETAVVYLRHMDGLRKLAVWTSIGQHAIANEADLIRTYKWADEKWAKQDDESVIGYLEAMVPEVAYLLQAMDDIGLNQARWNLMNPGAEAQVQCWCDDVFRGEVHQ